jgi:hypothetical protein
MRHLSARILFMRSPRTAAASWILSCAAIVAALAMVGCGTPAGQVEPRHPPRCSSLLFLGARGSGEDPSQQLAMGTTVYPIYTALRGADSRIVGYGWPYHGERPTLTQLSRDATALADFLNKRARQCPVEQIVLAGYSAGAALVGDTLQSPALTAAFRSRLVAAVLLADPEFNPADITTAAGTFDPRYGGSPRRAAFPAAIASRIRSYCRRHDIACQRQDVAANKIQHGNYIPQQTCQAAQFIESVAHLRNAKC